MLIKDTPLNIYTKTDFYPDDKELNSDYFKRLDKHRKEVMHILSRAVLDIAERSLKHDISKYNNAEKRLFKMHSMSDTTFGSKEYEKSKNSIKDAIELHYKNNRHHPEHFENGINDMNLIDILEMLVDWISASKCYNDDGNIYDSIKVCKDKFNIDSQLEQILINTVKHLEVS